jgi:predicted enzyme related to lactoylglutathione lyase
MSENRNPVGWFEIYVTDMPRARAFYEALLERTLVTLPAPLEGYEMLAFDGQPEGGGASGALVKHQMRKPSSEGTLVYFTCPDCSVLAARAAKNGGVVHLPKMAIGQYGFISIVGDTEGNAIGLHSMS